MPKKKLPELSALQDAKSLRSFAPLVGFTPSGLAYILYKTLPEERYRTFTIPKKGGGERTISAPTSHLQLLQTNLARLLNQCFEEINSLATSFRPASHGFRNKHSIVTNAREHRRKRYVLNLDLEDFFGSINFGRVRGYFISDKYFSLDPSVATIIAQIACHNNALPQGAPTSPIISNFIGQILDTWLVRLAKRHGCYYTRYVDDITFSTREKNFPASLSTLNPDARNICVIGNELRSCIERSGFSINESKTRMQIIGSRQEVAGLIVNQKVNVKQEYYRIVRCMCHSLFMTGTYFIPGLVDDDGKPKLLSQLAPLEGRLSFVYYVKDRRDLDPKVKKESKVECPKGFKELYKKFLFYKYFIISDIPVIVTEGKTDITYLSCAIKSLSEDFPLLVREEEGQKFANVRFVHPTYINQRVLNVGEGYGGIQNLLNIYSDMIFQYGNQKPRSPVILVVDNDDGGKSIFDGINNKYNKNITIKDSGLYFHITDNLYLVKTPSAGDKESCMEDLFPADILLRKLGKKEFDRSKKHGDHSSYGKAEFAEQVVRPNRGLIDFGLFKPVLEGVELSITHFGNQDQNG